MAIKSGGLRKRRRSPSESSKQRSRSMKNKAEKRKIHAEKYPNDKKSILGTKRWTADSQRGQKISVTSFGDQES